MASLYAQYVAERTWDSILEYEHGYATYRYTDTDKTVYIIDIYVEPEFRKQGLAAKMADEIVKFAQIRGCKKLIGSVVPSVKNSTASVKVLLAYGMSLDSSTENFILFKKDI